MTIGIAFSIPAEMRKEIANFIRMESDIQASHANIHRAKREKDKCEAAARFGLRLAKQIETGEL
jgi:hypothetical protein